PQGRRCPLQRGALHDHAARRALPCLRAAEVVAGRHPGVLRDRAQTIGSVNVQRLKPFSLRADSIVGPWRNLMKAWAAAAFGVLAEIVAVTTAGACSSRITGPMLRRFLFGMISLSG